MFEKVNIQDLKFNPFDEISNHWVLISAKKDGVVNTMTASWGQLGHLCRQMKRAFISSGV